jgi:hypothetical protein
MQTIIRVNVLFAVADIPEVLNSLRGPWSIIFWHARHQTLWFGRDVLGREWGRVGGLQHQQYIGTLSDMILTIESVD